MEHGRAVEEKKKKIKEELWKEDLRKNYRDRP
jgi:hypothetical protein